MSLIRIATILLVLLVCAAILSFILNVLQAILIVAGIGLALGVALSLRARRPRNASRLAASDRAAPSRRDK